MIFTSWDLTACDRILSASSGIVTSPGYPEHYSRNENCTSHITVQPGNVIELTFNSMAIAGTMPHCTEDYLEACFRISLFSLFDSQVIRDLNVQDKMPRMKYLIVLNKTKVITGQSI